MEDGRRARIDVALGEGAGGAPLGFWRAPGRVNLIGDHTDYQDGLCAPMAIDLDVLVGGRADDRGVVGIASLDLDGSVAVAADGSDDPASVQPEWGRVVGAAVHVLQGTGRAPEGFRGAVASTVPMGSGLSSSAAFSVGVCLALSSAAGAPLAGRELARVAQSVDQLATGVPCGILDQMSSVFGRAGHALRLDCRSLDVEAVALPREVEVVAVHSGLPRILADSEYSSRRAACEAAADRLGVATLRDATLDQVADDPFAHHVVTENARVQAFLAALERHDTEGAGRLMLESHRSLADDFRVSTVELDLLVDLLMRHGALGARLTGAGFGGCVIALVPAGSASIGTDAASEYRAHTGLDPLVLPVRAVDGAGRVEW